VVGATGGVGHAALQIGQILGVEVSTVSASDNMALCRDLGAVEVYDHEDLPDAANVTPFDAIIDCGGVVTGYYRNYLKPHGRMMTLSPDGLPAVLTSLFTNRRVGFLLATKATAEAMKWITTAVERGNLRPVIEKRYTLEELAEAQDYVDTKHTRGKLLVVM
jgi:possible oxidoreductase